ncbi:MAG: hypothetical protein M0T80_15865 [Actinomycetota bacterium]|nr:hypothetical protein [Actinomycetota bacterium]MDA8073389.1 hypothetical protein [Actinomycetota bacterium]
MSVLSVDITGIRVATPVAGCTDGPVWVTVRPNLRRIHTLAGDILAALGKRRDVGGKGRNESEDVTLAIAWLKAHDVTDLVMLEVQRLHPRILASLTKLADNAGVTLWLLHRPPIADAVHRAITRRSTGTRAYADVPEMAHHTAPSGPDLIALPPVPRHDFHCFIPVVTAALHGDARDRALELHRTAAQQANTTMATASDPLDSLAGEIVRLLRAAPEDSELVCSLRGIQLAAWHHDLHVAVDVPQLLNSEERPRTPVDEAGPALLAYRQPYRAVAWLLAREGVGLTEANQLPVQSASADGATIAADGRTIDVPPVLRPAVRAQHTLRADSPADAPLLPLTEKTLSRVLTTAAYDLGLPAHGRLAERQTLTPIPWLRKLGITIRTLP